MIERFFKKPTGDISIQVIRYSLAGGVATIADYSLLVILTEIFKVYYLISTAIAFSLGMVVSYILNVVWVFDKRAFKNRHLEIFIFALIGIAGLISNQILMWFFTEDVKLYYLVSKLISIVIVFFWNFFARKYILFN